MNDSSTGRSDPFEVLGLEPRFELDAAAIDAAWMRRLRAAHPDRAGGGEEHSEVARSAASLNEARSTLREPLARGEALLARRGHVPGDASALPPSFLPEMLELRERVEEAVESGVEATIDEVAQEADRRRRDALARLAALFAEPSAPSTSSSIRLELNVLRYFDRLREELRQVPRRRA